MHRRHTHRGVVIALLALGGLSVVGCASGEFRDGLRFWGDHAGAVVLGDDPAKD